MAQAVNYLTINQWSLDDAIANYYQVLEDSSSSADYSDPAPPPPTQPIPTSIPSEPIPGGGRRLGDTSSTPQAIPVSASQPAAKQKSKAPPSGNKKFATLGDIASSSSHAGHGHAQADDGDDSDEDQDFFAGGEKSALAVQNPDELKRKIIEKAKRAQPPPRPSAPTPRSAFTGPAQTLGSDDTPSQPIPGPSSGPTTRSQNQNPPPVVERQLHFWADGFSVDDGPLYRSDDPANAGHLAMIRMGRAPLEIMNVQKGEEVDVKLVQHEEKYVKPKKKYVPFSGGGQRLGSPVPGVSDTTAPSISSSSPANTAAAQGQQQQQQRGGMDVDESQPTISLQVRLGDGTRLSSQFNTSHTIGDVYDFVGRASPGSAGRAWVLMTTFPSKELTNKGAKLGDLGEFRRGGVVVQKWT